MAQKILQPIAIVFIWAMVWATPLGGLSLLESMMEFGGDDLYPFIAVLAVIGAVLGYFTLLVDHILIMMEWLPGQRIIAIMGMAGIMGPFGILFFFGLLLLTVCSECNVAYMPPSLWCVILAGGATLGGISGSISVMLIAKSD